MSLVDGLLLNSLILIHYHLLEFTLSLVEILASYLLLQLPLDAYLALQHSLLLVSKQWNDLLQYFTPIQHKVRVTNSVIIITSLTIWLISCEFNHTKSGVVTFGETKPMHSRLMKERDWTLGDTKVDELYEHKNLGI